MTVLIQTGKWNEKGAFSDSLRLLVEREMSLPFLAPRLESIHNLPPSSRQLMMDRKSSLVFWVISQKEGTSLMSPTPVFH